MKTIAIISQKGGAGKTTIGIHLAVAAQLRSMNTALFGLDPQASASSWSDRRNKPSPAVVSAQAARLPSLLEQAAAQSADLVIIDSAQNADVASLAAVRAADLIRIPYRPSAFDLGAIGTTLNLAVVAGKPAYVVLNAVPPLGKVGEAARRALQEGGVEVAARVLSSHSSTERRDVLGKPNAHEVASEGLGQVFPIWREKAQPLASSCRALADEHQRQRVHPPKVHDAELARLVAQVGPREQMVSR
jgi:chromosome partitioning protein